jgi:hypothetical protein
MTTPEPTSAHEVNMEALSDEEIDGLLGADAASGDSPDPKEDVR